MKNKNLHIIFFFLGIYFGSTALFFAQTKEQDTLAIVKNEVNQDDLGNVTDDFQENFFKGLAQKAIENYEKALVFFKKCDELKPKETAVYFELGKTYKALKEYTKAEDYLKKALVEKENNQAILTELFDLYFLTQNYTSAISMAKQLTTFNIDYYEDLANLYLLTKQYNLALQALDVIDEKEGQSDYRDSLRRKIFVANDNQQEQVTYLKQKLAKNPENIQHYSNLIFYYGEIGKVQEAYNVALDLQEKHPEAIEAQLALYKMYMQQNKQAEALASMKKILKSKQLSFDIKEKVVNDFTAFVKENPQYESDLVEALGEELQHGGKQSNKQLGEYYMGKDNAKAITYFQQALNENPNEFDLLKKTALLEIKEQQYEAAQALVERALAVYPSQPIFYLLQGVSLNALQQYKKANESLEMGLDFLIDNPKMEKDFYEQLSIAQQNLGNTQKAETYKQKAAAIKIP